MWLNGDEEEEKANFYKANLHNADLYGVDLRQANFCKANLLGADLRNSDLRGAHFCNADLYGADLRGADLRNADLISTDLRQAKLPTTLIQIGPIGSRRDYTTCFVDDDVIQCGCWRGTLEQFKKRIDEIYPAGGEYKQYRKEYLAVIAMLEVLYEK